MTKKGLVEVDEEMLKGIMVGDVPVFGRKSGNGGMPPTEAAESPIKGVIEAGVKSESEQPIDNAKARPPEKEKKGAPKNIREIPDAAIGYRELFLVNAPSSSRAQTYINRDTYELIKRFLPVIAPDISISGYISNVLVEHLGRYWEAINKMYNEENSKPLKR